MLNSAKVEKLMKDLAETVSKAEDQDLEKLTDEKLGKLYFSTDAFINAFDSFIDRIDSAIISRGGITIPDLGQKIVREDEPVLKIKKMSKAELKAAENKSNAAAESKKSSTAKKASSSRKKS